MTLIVQAGAKCDDCDNEGKTSLSSALGCLYDYRFSIRPQEILFTIGKLCTPSAVNIDSIIRAFV